MILRIPVRAVHRLLASLLGWHGESPRANAPRRWLDPVAHRPPRRDLTSQARAALLLRACVCIRLKDLEPAQAILCGTGLAKSDPARLNLLGVICEMQKQWRRARQFYGRAIRADRAYEPPRQNLRRLYELNTFGRSCVPVTLGDEDPQLWAQRAEFLRRLESEDRLQLDGVNYHDN